MESIQKWTVEVAEQQYGVTITDAGSGKLAIRVNDRVVARPFSDGDTERTFEIDGIVYRMTRASDGTFDLQLDEPTRQPQPNVGAADLGASWFNARAMLWGFIAVLAVAPLLWYFAANTYSRRAQRRVEEMLAGMITNPDQSTIGLWARNTRHLADLREISWASDHFDDWRREKDLYKPISSWHVISVREAPTKDVPAVLIRVVIDGRDLVMLVPDRRPISWAEDPG